MKEFTIQDWREVCQRARQYINYMPPDYNTLNEMSYNPRRFQTLCDSICKLIHYSIINICCLSDITPNDVRHWTYDKLLPSLSKLIDSDIHKNVNRTRTIFESIIEPYLDSDTYAYNSNTLYIKAMQDEIRKGENSKEIWKQRVAQIIKKDVLPNIDNIRIMNNQRTSRLFKNIIKLSKTTNLDITVEDIVEEFLDDNKI